MPTKDHSVLIVGGGPTGLMLAGELSLAGIDVAILERRLDQSVDGSRAGGLHARTLEVLDQRGIVERFLAAGKTAQVAGFAWNPIDISDFPTRHPYGLALWQRHIERLLAEWVVERGVRTYRGVEVTDAFADSNGAGVTLADGRRLLADYVVGCDGGRSLMRKAAGIAFAGTEPTISHIIAEARLSEDPPWGMRRDEIGIHGLSRLPEDGLVRIMVTEREVQRGSDVTLDELRAAMIAIYGSDYGVHDATWISRFTDTARQAERYRNGRLLLAGDAAHIHYPVGGQGLNLGVQDAVNLGFKLALVVKGAAPESLLDSYGEERHPVAARVLDKTLAQVALLRGADRHREALRATIAELVRLDDVRRSLGGMMSGLDIRYDFGPGHPLLGRRLPDLDLITADGPRRVYEYLHAAQPVLISFGGEGPALGAWSGTVQHVAARVDGQWELPVIGRIEAPEAVLVRPDGYVAWAGGDGLDAALLRWCGSPPRSSDQAAAAGRAKGS